VTWHPIDCRSYPLRIAASMAWAAAEAGGSPRVAAVRFHCWLSRQEEAAHHLRGRTPGVIPQLGENERDLRLFATGQTRPTKPGFPSRAD
jgi:hypothetical protein